VFSEQVTTNTFANNMPSSHRIDVSLNGVRAPLNITFKDIKFKEIFGNLNIKRVAGILCKSKEY